MFKFAFGIRHSLFDLLRFRYGEIYPQMTETFSGFKGLMIRIADAMKAALFPPKCLVCSAFFKPEAKQVGCLAEDYFQDESIFVSSRKTVFEKLMASFLCKTCLAGFLPVESPFCSGCGIMFKSREGKDHFCGECLESPKRYNMARSPGIYDSTLLAAIHLLKYRGKIQLARPLGLFLFLFFITLWDEKLTDVIVPVPLHFKRLKKRGFNQALLLVKDWGFYAKIFDLELSHMPVERNLIVRNRWTEPQTGLDRKSRKANIKNAFRIRDAEELDGERVLLVDDVYTTGATADECTKVLLAAGARQVDVLTLARAI